ncbi:hypothetical protein Q5O89_09760 [Peribacillus frigoritolerans]|nr:hypothetical protein [Peribacillus frigoritolerans]
MIMLLKCSFQSLKKKKAVTSEKAMQPVEQPVTIVSNEKVEENVKELHKKSTQELRKLANSLNGFPLSPKKLQLRKKRN